MSPAGKGAGRVARLGRHLIVTGAGCLLVVLGRDVVPVAAVAKPVAAAAAAPAILNASAGIAVAVSNHHALVRFGVGADTDLRTPSGLSAESIDRFLAGSAMAGLGAAFVAAEQRYHVNARYLIAHAIEESAWGSSVIAQAKHNLYGYGAVDWNPFGGAEGFPDFTTAVDFQARMVAQDYLTPGGAHWGGAPTLNGMHRHYATDPHWVRRILDVAALIPD